MHGATGIMQSLTTSLLLSEQSRLVALFSDEAIM